jgi:hypothetical protein
MTQGLHAGQENRPPFKSHGFHARVTMCSPEKRISDGGCRGRPDGHQVGF